MAHELVFAAAAREPRAEGLAGRRASGERGKQLFSSTANHACEMTESLRMRAGEQVNGSCHSQMAYQAEGCDDWPTTALARRGIYCAGVPPSGLRAWWSLLDQAAGEAAPRIATSWDVGALTLLEVSTARVSQALRPALSIGTKGGA